MFVTGAAVQWLRDGLGIIGEAAETEALAGVARLQRRRLLRPRAHRPRLAALGPLRARHDRRPHARDGRAHLARAALEAIAYQTVDAVRAQEAASGERLAELKADGGAVANRWLMQFQADVLGAPVIVPEIAETTALGAAYLAGIATGFWDRDEVAEMWREAARYEPAMGDGRARGAARPLARGGRARRGWAQRAGPWPRNRAASRG